MPIETKTGQLMPDSTSLVTGPRIETLTEIHYPAVKQIYKKGIATGIATLEIEAPSWPIWNANHFPFARYVALLDEKTVGWAALSPVSGRCVYSGVAEISVYIDNHFQGLGIGTRLLRQVIGTSEENGIWTLQAGIIKENKASMALHQRCGFRVVGLREKLGKLHNEWRDIYLLERRSTVMGL